MDKVENTDKGVMYTALSEDDYIFELNEDLGGFYD